MGHRGATEADLVQELANEWTDLPALRKAAFIDAEPRLAGLVAHLAARAKIRLGE